LIRTVFTHYRSLIADDKGRDENFARYDDRQEPGRRSARPGLTTRVPSSVNQPAIAAFLEALHARLTEVRPRLLGERA